MGIDLSSDINRPYLSVNIREFWRRWHISLSSWFRDYVYISLGGNKKGRLRTYSYVLFTFILSAVWHGAGWTFMVWGLLHGMYTLIYDGLKKYLSLVKLSDFFAWTSVYNIVSLQGSTVDFGNFTLAFSFCMIAYMFIVEKFTTPKLLNLHSKKIMDLGIFTNTLLFILFFGVFQKSTFIYFQF